jgi:hypothetical protein
MAEISELLITIIKTDPLISFEFSDGNTMQLPKESLKSCSEYFRTMCSNEIENQYIEINSYSHYQTRLLKHFLICLSNGYRNIIPELPVDDSLKVLEFQSFLKLDIGIVSIITENISELSYDIISTVYHKYWNYRYISFQSLEKVAKRESNLKVILAWLDEDSWPGMTLLESAEFLQCKQLLENNTHIIPTSSVLLLSTISNFKLSYYIIDLKKLLNSIIPTTITNNNYK